jgi:hypothetical protein
MDLITYQKALYQALKKQGINVYDYVPFEAPLPYVRLDYSQVYNDGTKTTELFNIIQYINVFSEYKGQKEVKEIIEKINTAIKDIEGVRFYLQQAVIREVKEKTNTIQGANVGAIQQGTLILKVMEG